MSWTRFHRAHHKHTETEADPNNAQRGFFFAHAGWFLVKEHPEVTRAKAVTDISDVLSDPIAFYQHKYRIYNKYDHFHTYNIVFTVH